MQNKRGSLEENFSSKIVSMDHVKKVVLKLNSKKSFTYGAIPFPQVS